MFHSKFLFVIVACKTHIYVAKIMKVEFNGCREHIENLGLCQDFFAGR